MERKRLPYVSYLIVAEVSAVKDAWFVGDQFLQTIFGSLTAVRNEAYKSNKRCPFICDYFNIRAYWTYTPSSTIHSVIARIYNSVIKALNENLKLPRFIIVVPGRDILRRAAFYKFGASLVIGDNVEWLIDNITRVVETRKSDLRDRKPGVVTSSEPKLIWIKMLYRPGKERLQKLRTKYNEILEENLANHRFCYIIDPDKGLTNEDFDMSNQLTATGKIAFWQYLDDQLKKFDRQEIELKPQKIITITREQAEQQKAKFILPRPPRESNKRHRNDE